MVVSVAPEANRYRGDGIASCVSQQLVTHIVWQAHDATTHPRRILLCDWIEHGNRREQSVACTHTAQQVQVVARHNHLQVATGFGHVCLLRSALELSE